MERPQELSYWDFPDTKHVPDGYYLKSVPESTTDNFNRLLEKYNGLVELVNVLADKAGIEFDD